MSNSGRIYCQRDDEVGNICRRDETILKIGSFFFDEGKRKLDRTVRSNMRRMGHLYIKFFKGQEITHVQGNAADKLRRGNFQQLKEAIEAYTSIDYYKNKIWNESCHLLPNKVFL